MNRSKAWRLIPVIETTGKMQMAIDIWLLEQHLLGNLPPTLRFYTWSQPTISLGYHQRNFPAHWKNLLWQERPVELVKRPTGGRGVLHHGDLTYAFVSSEFIGKRAQVYCQICKFLIDGWRSLGVELSFGTAGRGYIHNPNCFGTATSADLVCNDGYKLIGSAQLIRSGAILQHGSMRIDPDLELCDRVFGEPMASPPPSVSRLEIAELVSALVNAASEYFDVDFCPQPLSEQEWSEIAIVATKI
ncbi:MAG: lipoate--protein ligase family protein [Leptolyngbyaceae cyanobacterium RU_5_1]|nr:lipoate--protein ligase family protein [Leptolyngbyaceae cyanobacterium RU_5_1]